MSSPLAEFLGKPETPSGPAPAIRRAAETDIAGVVECLSASFQPFREAYTVEAFRDTVLSGDFAVRRLRDMTVLVAQDEVGQIVGTVAYKLIGAGEGHIRGMAVLPARQGSGIAAGLLAAAEEGLRAQGCLRVTLNTTEVLERARRFYRREGYGTTGIVRDFYGMRLIEHEKIL